MATLAIYFVLAFAISWGGLLAIGGLEGLSVDTWQSDPMLPLMVAAMLAGPSAAGIGMTALVSGRAGLRELLARLLRWRVGMRWYGVALLVAPCVFIVVHLALSLVSPVFLPSVVTVSDSASLALASVSGALAVGFFEEIGWTGFAVPHLRARHSMLTTGLVVGAVWGLWHFPLFWEADSFSATLPFTILLTRLFAWLPPFRVLLVSIHEHTRSLPVVMLMHSAVSFASIVFAQQGGTGAQLLISPLVAAATMWLLVAAVRIAERRRFADHSLKPSIA